MLKPVGIPTPCPTKGLLPVCSNLKYCNLQTLFTLFCDDKCVRSTMWLRRDNVIVQRLPMTISSLLYSEDCNTQIRTRLWSPIPPFTLCSTRHTTFWEFEAFISMFFAHHKSFCVHFYTVFWPKSNPSNPGFRLRPNPGLKTAGLPGFSGTRVSFPSKHTVACLLEVCLAI